MIDIIYYNNQIREEIDGSIDYLNKAIKYREDKPAWANTYYKMSEMELGHAQNLFKIFEEDFKENRTDDPLYNELYDSLLSTYTESAANVKHMQELFNK